MGMKQKKLIAGGVCTFLIVNLGYVAAGQPGAGSLQSVTNPLPNSVIAYGYDALVQSIQIGGAGASVQRDDLGRIYWSSNALGVTTIQYVGATDRPLLVTQPNGFGTRFAYTPVANGLIQAMATTNGARQVIARCNRILWQTNTIGGVTNLWSYAYDLSTWPTSQVWGISSVTNIWTYAYDLSQQLTAATLWTNGVIAHRYAYAYDKAGNQTSEQIDASAATERTNPHATR
jgi:hypothetical protein